jgi:polyisoprenoid-binding protein YceI
MEKVIYVMFAAAIFVGCNSAETESESTENVSEATAHSFDLTKTVLTWTAFKTPDKVGVPGSFDDVMLKGNMFTINAKSVNSNNEIRDEKLKTFFFSNLSDSLITGSYGNVMDGKIPVTIKMNGIEKTFDFDFAENDSSTVVSGSIDILADFSGNAALEAISEACKELHLNKTWSDVNLKVVEIK